MHQAIITLLTDFGLADPYVGVMKGVMLGINPELKFVDITHSIPQGDIKKAAFRLFTAYKYFPKNTIHLVVVDPGVGTKRNPIIVKTKDYYFVGPDNGIFSWIYSKEKFKVYKININSLFSYLGSRDFRGESQCPSGLSLSNTFHGRDIFAPTAACLSLGIKPKELGKLIDHWLSFKPPTPVRTRHGVSLQGEVIDIDQFGNLITNISKSDFCCFMSVEEIMSKSELSYRGSRGFRGKPQSPELVSGSELPLSRGSQDFGAERVLGEGKAPLKFELKIKNCVIYELKSWYEGNKPIAIFGSAGFLEISLPNANCASFLHAKIGTKVTIKKL